MNDQPPAIPANRLCPACGAEVTAKALQCWLCLCALPLTVGSSSNVALPPPLPSAAPQDAHFTFSLSTLFLAITLICVLLGLSVIAPGLGIPLLILAIPAWIRSARAVAVAPRSALSTDTSFKIEKFMESLGLIILVSLAAGAAGFAACSAVCFAGMGMSNEYGALTAGFTIGGFTVVGVFIWLFVKWWPKRKKIG